MWKGLKWRGGTTLERDFPEASAQEPAVLNTKSGANAGREPGGGKLGAGNGSQIGIEAAEESGTRQNLGNPRAESGGGTQARNVAELEEELALYRGILEQVTEVATEAAKGNLEARILHCENSEKLRTVARSVNHLLDMTDAFLREAGASLEYASRGKFFRRVLLRGMRGTFRHKSQLINEATGRTAKNYASLHEVERLVSSSAGIAQEAVREATEASEVVRTLGEASTKIAEVMKSISQVAWQTKLLAFNARIEASRAGEAGRGFEVVAQEVKNLAQQTAAAAEGIAQEVAGMREEVERTTQAIGRVSKTIAQMQEISASIESAVAERTSRRESEGKTPQQEADHAGIRS